MSLKRINNYDTFLAIVTALNEEIRVSGKDNLTSIHSHAEVFSLGLLNLLFGWSLIDANEETRNIPGIDLIDHQNKYMVQVSAECTKAKIGSSLSKKIVKEYNDKGYQIKFLFIGYQNDNAKGWKPVDCHDVAFEPKSDVILTCDLAHRFKSLSVDDQDAVIQFLNKEIGREYSIKLSDVTEKLNRAIRSLGPRYTPEVNVSTENEIPLETLMVSGDFRREFEKKAKKTAAYVNQVRPGSDDSTLIRSWIKEFSDKAERLTSLLSSVDENMDEVNWVSWALSIWEALANLEDMAVCSDWVDGKTLVRIPDAIRSASASVSSLKRFMHEQHLELLKGYFLVIEGKAGVGKSHMLADFCKRALSQGHLPFLFLGQHFVAGIDPWKQILDEISPELTEVAFFEELERFALTHSKKAFIVIDALNEGDGKRLWKSHLQRFVDKLADYPDIKLILSLRSTFKDTVIPDLFFEQNKVVLVEHVGFGSKTFNAIAEYCDYFEIAPPAVPIFGEEYENPLFLKLVCSRIAKSSKRVFAKNYTLGEVLESYLEDINSKISEPIYLNYDKRNNLVSVAVEAIVSHEEFKYGFLPFGCAYQAVHTAVEGYCDSSSRFLTALIDESLLISSQRYEDDEEIILFSFERIGDYYKALSLLPPVETGGLSQRDQIMCSKEISGLFDSESSISLSQGVLEALAIILPEKYGIEFYEITPKELIDKPYMIDHYVQGLSWRLVGSLKDADKRYIDEYVWGYSLTSRNFLAVLVRNSIEIESVFNADYLDATLAGMALLTRDAIWTTFASESEELERLVDWLWDNYEKLPDNLIELAEVLLAWCLTSTKRFLRDCATKAITCLIIRKPSSGWSLLKRFIGIDDMYVVERILAAMYGAISHTSRDESWVESAEEIYEHVFSPHGTYPHVLVRDYAYSIVSSAVRYHNLDAGRFERMYPPYESDWYKISPTNDDIDKFQAEVEEKHGKRSWQSNVVWRLIHSMTTEYGRGTCAYGDFGRYVFGSNVHEWNNQFDDQCLSNIVTWRILSLDHFLERFGEFDYSVARFCNDRYDHAVERIGKKYQWIGMFELIARLVDNYPPYTEKKDFATEYIEYRDSRVASMLAMLSDNDIASSEFEEDSRFDNEDDFVTSVEKNYLSDADITRILIDLRNVDPSFIWKESNLPTPYQLMPNYFASIDGQGDWAKGSFIYSDLENHRIFEINGRQYISLYTYVSQKKGTESRRGYCDESLIWNSAACFMRQEDIPAFNESYLSIDGGSVPTARFFHCFLYDHFDGVAYKSQMSLHEEERSEDLPEFSYATQEYFWEAYNDSSLGEEASADIMLPSEDLVRHFNLYQVGRGRWLDGNGDTICFDSNSLGYKEKMLLFDISSLRAYLTEKKLALVWGEYFDKTSSSTRHEWWRTVHMSNDSFLVSIIDESEYDWDPKLY